MGMSKNLKGFFLTLEGGEGVGKSTQARALQKLLEKRGYDVVLTREPGGSPAAEAIREVILSGHAKELGPLAEASLFTAARADHVRTLIRPALEEGKVVICDRYSDSTFVYQGVVGGVDPDIMDTLEKTGCLGVMPDLTLVLDLPVEIALERARQQSRQEGRKEDRFEMADASEHEIIRKGFLQRAGRDKGRYAVISAEGSTEQVTGRIRSALSRRKVLRPLKKISAKKE
jgi:dTMP kinase